MTKALAAGAVGALLVVTACLGAIPEAAQCPPAPVHRACPQSLPAPQPGPGGTGGPIAPVACTLLQDACLRADRGDCSCNPGKECTRSSSTCFPAPDCPEGVRKAAASASCLQTTATLVPSGPLASPCLCGCVSCSTTCDGQGPVVGPNQALRFEITSNVPTSGKLGVMARLRGAGRVTVVVFSQAGVPSPLGELTVTSTDFLESLTGGGSTWVSWPAAPGRPIAIGLRTDDLSSVEIDCVVPYFTN